MSVYESQRSETLRLDCAAARCRPWSSWRQPPHSLSLTAGDVHLWVAPLDWTALQVKGLADVLSEDERARASRFFAERDRRRFIVCRGVLRIILGRYLSAGPAALEFTYGACGKPAVAIGSGRHALRFNVSHAADMALYGVTLGREIGVDLERIRSDFATDEIAGQFFSANEVAIFHAVNPASRVQAFFRIWTRKEAYLKATGRGFSASPWEFDVSFRADDPTVHLSTPGNPREASRWRLQELFADADYVAAIAVEGHSWRLRRWRYEGYRFGTEQEE